MFTVNLIPCRPLLGEIVDLDLNVDLQTTVSIETDAETSDSKVVVGECTNNPESISLTVLHRSGPHISAEQGIPEEQGPKISALFLTWEGAEYGKKKSEREKSSDSGVKLALPLTCVFIINLAYRSFSYHIFKVGNIT